MVADSAASTGILSFFWIPIVRKALLILATAALLWALAACGQQGPLIKAPSATPDPTEASQEGRSEDGVAS